ncbi:MAG: type II/IV secretion system protein [Candidatus Omnitrophica bacterium]|nr:type II/IV secretion system protein [Candidatus Omnitrophota bacterium]
METIDLLLKQGALTAEQVAKAREEVKRTGMKIEQALEKLGFINEEDIVKVKAESIGVLYMDLGNYLIDADLVRFIPEGLARKYKVAPVFKIANTLTVAMADPQDIEALDEIRKVSGIDDVETVMASGKGILRILDSYYGATGTIDEIVKVLEKENIAALKGKSAEAAEEPPIIKLVNLLIMEAVKSKVSDIHIEPEHEVVRVRYRIDGILREAHIFPSKLQQAVISRIKILSEMDIAETRRPQDGKIHLRLENKDLDIRISTFPTIHGENVVMRLLDKSSLVLGLKDLGLGQENLANLEKLIRQPHGIVLVTGPTGSGKTTTLYAALVTISSAEKNIITIEDPVEYELPLIRQTQVNPKADITFANGLRSILRQDPDVIMVGEIRDKETAETAIQAALTGHLVFSTLHTNDACSALTRLIDMGVEPFLISSSVIGIMAQRLVRTLCEKCRQAYTPAAATLKDFGVDEKINFYRGAGCTRCKNTGFAGRLSISEFLVINEDIRKMVNEKVSADIIKKKAVSLGMKTLREDGLEKAKNGLTSLEEVLRVTEGD